MNPDHFNALDLNRKVDIVFSDGDFISDIKYYGFKVCLYIIDSTYVEVFYNLYSNEIDEISILDPEEGRLQLYSAGVDLKDLFS